MTTTNYNPEIINPKEVRAAYLAFITAAINAAADRLICDQCGQTDRLQNFKRPNRDSLNLCRSCFRGATEQNWIPLLAWPRPEMEKV